MLKNVAELKKYLKSGGKLKCVFHMNPKSVFLNTTRSVIRMTLKEWEFEGGSFMIPPPKDEEIQFSANGFSLLLPDKKPWVSYEYRGSVPS